MQFHDNKEKILIIDFGSQVTKLIARRVRDLGVYSEIITPKDTKKIRDFTLIKGIILSGGSFDCNKTKVSKNTKTNFYKKIPILGICYGLQLIAKIFGGKIKSLNKKERIW